MDATLALRPAAANGNKSRAARILQTNYNTLHSNMKRFDISALEFRASGPAARPPGRVPYGSLPMARRP